MKLFCRNTLGLCSSSLLAIVSLLAPVQVNAVDSHVSAKEFVYRLGEACGDEDWRRVSGPSSALVRNLGERSYARLYESGTYKFVTDTCCAATGRSSLADLTSRSSLSRINALMSSGDLVGFGARTTGGSAAQQYTVVRSLNDSGSGTLRDALSKKGPLWITFADSIKGGTIYLNSGIRVLNKSITIDGAGSGITVTVRKSSQFPMFQFLAGNAIIHGVTIDGGNSRSTGLMLREGNNYWVDHVTVKNFIYDDGITIGRADREATSTSEVTISNYHAYNTNYAFLGGGNDSVSKYPPYRVTIHSSIMSAEDRNPRVKNYGTVHLFNNYIHSFRFSGATAGANSTIYSQNNVFSAMSARNPKMALAGIANGNMRNGGRSGRVYTSGDVFLDKADHSGDVRPTASRSINLPYSYSLKSPTQVLDHVNASAGATGSIGSGGGESSTGKTPVAEAPAAATPTSADTESSCSVQTRVVTYVRRTG